MNTHEIAVVMHSVVGAFVADVTAHSQPGSREVSYRYTISRCIRSRNRNAAAVVEKLATGEAPTPEEAESRARAIMDVMVSSVAA